MLRRLRPRFEARRGRHRPTTFCRETALLLRKGDTCPIDTGGFHSRQSVKCVLFGERLSPCGRRQTEGSLTQIRIRIVRAVRASCCCAQRPFATCQTTTRPTRTWKNALPATVRRGHSAVEVGARDLAASTIQGDSVTRVSHASPLAGRGVAEGLEARGEQLTGFDVLGLSRGSYIRRAGNICHSPSVLRIPS